MTGGPVASGSSAAAAVSMRDIHKSFGAVRANRGAELVVAPGDIHALVGENGAGKSTLMRVLSGMYPPDLGSIAVHGRDVTGWSTADAIEAGVGMVHQHFMLIPTLTVAENVVLGREPVRRGTLDRAAAVAAVTRLAERTGLRVEAERLVSELSVGEAQRVEILKTLYRGARILILDEPTAVLSPPEVTELWQVLRAMRDDGGTIILITHKLDEVMQVSNAITVMRQGETVARLRTADTNPAAIARAMVGREVALAQWKDREPAAPSSGPGLVVHDLRVRSDRRTMAVDGISFEVAGGEILGVAGVEGNGQTELVEAIAGLRPVESGTIRLRDPGGTSHDATARTVRDRAELGLSHIPEDRHQRGLILEYSVAENLVLGQQHRYARRGLLSLPRIRANAREKVTTYDVRPPEPMLAARALSGGNQQKVVVAREMGRPFSVLLAAQPTRGVDVGAIEFIHDRLRGARAEGKAILLVSADLGEIMALSDRIAVMFGGRLVAIMPRAGATEAVIGEHMMGLSLRGAGRA